MNTTPVNPTTNARVWIGLDVSQDTLDVCMVHAFGNTSSKQFANNAAGSTKLVQWVTRHTPHASRHFCLEATGAYSTAVATFLAAGDHTVSVVNPARVHYFALAQGQGNKTDKAAAYLLALFCRTEAPPVWRAATPAMRHFIALVRRLHALQALLSQEKNRAAVPGQPAEIHTSIQTIVTCLGAEVERLRQGIRDHLTQHAALQNDITLLQSIPGIGEITQPGWSTAWTTDTH